MLAIAWNAKKTWNIEKKIYIYLFFSIFKKFIKNSNNIPSISKTIQLTPMTWCTYLQSFEKIHQSYKRYTYIYMFVVLWMLMYICLRIYGAILCHDSDIKGCWFGPLLAPVASIKRHALCPVVWHPLYICYVAHSSRCTQLPCYLLTNHY